MRRLIFTILILTVGIAPSYAVPAKPGMVRTLTLADGTQVEAELRGDEYCHYWLASDGKAYVPDGQNRHYIPVDRNKAEDAGAMRRAKANAARQGRAPQYVGKKRGLIILVEFPKRTSTNTPAVTFTVGEPQAYYDRVANEPGFTDEEVGFDGSVYDYFLAQSDGQFEFNFDVVGPYKLGNPYNYYGQDDSGMLDTHLGKFVYDACRKADADVDFTQYDWDGDGTVDQLFVLYAGQGQNVNGEDAGLIWPQEGTLNAVGSDQKPFDMDGVTIDRFACSCELGENSQLDGIGTICHEFSHCFGLPDMYDKGTSFGATSLHYGTYVWDLMNMGNYLGGGFLPAGYTAYERMFCGWKTLTELTETTQVEAMRPLSDGGEAYIVRNDAYPDEYYILENRQRVGCDRGLYASGLLVCHVDYSAEAWNANDVNTTKERFSIFAADNSWQRTEADVRGDLYPYGGNDALTSTSTPAASLIHPGADGSMYMGKDITDITQNADGTISFSFTCAEPDGIATLQGRNGEKAPSYGLDGRPIHDGKPYRYPYIQGGRIVSGNR